jgi:very-short-patch-repair endonuclease
MNQNPRLPTLTRGLARSLRGAQTDAEAELWFHLRAGRLSGLKFRRQHAFPPYVVDLDGSQHTVDADAARSAALQQQGLRIMRFWNNDVLQQTESVLVAILNAVRYPTLTPTPLPVGEGLQE